MQRRHIIQSALLATLPSIARSEVYLSTSQARNILLPSATRPSPVTLTEEQMKAIAKASGVRVRSLQIDAHRAPNGAWLIFDNVLGKHEFIDIAVAISSTGQSLGVEVLTYRETYGGEVRNPKWRAQFHGKQASSQLKLDEDIKNISGATLSCRHITDGMKRLLHTWQLVLSKL